MGLWSKFKSGAKKVAKGAESAAKSVGSTVKSTAEAGALKFKSGVDSVVTYVAGEDAQKKLESTAVSAGEDFSEGKFIQGTLKTVGVGTGIVTASTAGVAVKGTVDAGTAVVGTVGKAAFKIGKPLIIVGVVGAAVAGFVLLKK